MLRTKSGVTVLNAEHSCQLWPVVEVTGDSSTKNGEPKCPEDDSFGITSSDGLQRLS